jgi:heme-degrading monooxygenase HmoA
MTSRPVRATLAITVRAGEEGSFERAWRDVAAEVRLMPGSLRQALLRDPARPSAFVITSDWATAEAFRAFERSTRQDALTAPLRSLRESASMTVHELLTHLEGDDPCPHE